MGNLLRKQVKDQGKKAREPEETMLRNSPPYPLVRELVSVEYLPVKSLEPGKWWVHGIHEEHALTAGLRRLDKNGWMCQLPDKPRDPKFSSKPLFQNLIRGERYVNELPSRDISAAQDELEHLTLRELLGIRVENQAYLLQEKCECASKVKQFMQKLDTLLLQRLGSSVSGKMFSDLTEDGSARPFLHRLGRDVAIVAAAALTIKEPCWWVCFAAQHRFLLNPSTMKVSTLFPQNCGVLEFADYSKVDPDNVCQVPMLDWDVRHVVSEHEVSLERLCLENPMVRGLGRQRE